MDLSKCVASHSLLFLVEVTDIFQSPFYHPFQGWVGNKIGYNLFTTREPALHTALKQPVAHAYGIKSALEFEPIVDECIETMVRRLDEEFVKTKIRRPCDLAAWIQYCRSHISFPSSLDT